MRILLVHLILAGFLLPCNGQAFKDELGERALEEFLRPAARDETTGINETW